MKADLKTIVISILCSVLVGIGTFYITTKIELGIMDNKISLLNESISELKSDKKELSEKLYQLSEKVSLLDYRVGTIKPDQVDVIKNINPTSPKTSIPLKTVFGGK